MSKYELKARAKYFASIAAAHKRHGRVIFFSAKPTEWTLVKAIATSCSKII
jgi:hypothetical protein